MTNFDLTIHNVTNVAMRKSDNPNSLWIDIIFTTAEGETELTFFPRERSHFDEIVQKYGIPPFSDTE